MFSLLEAIIGFAVIMLMLSLLVKSFTSILKNHIDYYTKNLEMEVKRFISGTLEKANVSVDEKSSNLLSSLNWQRLGEEYLTKENMQWLLTQMGVSKDKLDLESLQSRLEVHKANIRYAFEKRTKNIALSVGLALCLFMNINAFSIWERLYSDQQLRAKFSSQDYVQSVIKKIDEEDNNPSNSDADPSEVEANEKKARLAARREKIREKFYHFRGEVNFGVGKIYSQKLDGIGFLYEFFGSLLTGILVSIGAPYWHDILRLFTNMRKRKET
jgi:hypothetical protein